MLCIFCVFTHVYFTHVCEFLQGRLQPNNCSKPVARTWYSATPPGISDGVFQLRIGNVWFCKLLLLFKIDTKTDAGMKKLDCAFVSVMVEYTSHSRPGTADIQHIVYILHIMHILHILRSLYLLKIKSCFPQRGWINARQLSNFSLQKEAASTW